MALPRMPPPAHAVAAAAAASSSSRQQRQMHQWGWRKISVGKILRYQHWGGLLLLIPSVIIIALSHWTFQQRPVIRQALVYDPAISYPIRPDTISNSLATLYNWLLLLAVLCIVELAVFRHSLNVALASIIHHAWCCLIGFLIVIAVAEVTKPFSGRLRPDFLARCLGPQGYEKFAATPMSSVHLGQVVQGCIADNPDLVNQGRLSFPSGHSSNTMAVAWYTCLYLMWSLYLRHDAPCPCRLYEAKSLAARLLQEVWYALAYALVLLALCLSWFIGMTRFWDDVHNISDIVGGWLLAIIFTTPVLLKAVGLNRAFALEIDGHPGLLPVHYASPPAAAAAANGRSSLSPAGPLLRDDAVAVEMQLQQHHPQQQHQQQQLR